MAIKIKVVITRSRLTKMKLYPVFPGSRQCYELIINYILRLHVKSFILARLDPSFTLPGSRFARAKFSHVIASVRLSVMKKLINTPVWKYLKKYVSIDRRRVFSWFSDLRWNLGKKISRFPSFLLSTDHGNPINLV